MLTAALPRFPCGVVLPWRAREGAAVRQGCCFWGSATGPGASEARRAGGGRFGDAVGRLHVVVEVGSDRQNFR